MEREVCPELVRLLRVQRHDFINHLQVVHALIQMGRAEKALAYIERIAHSDILLEEPLREHQATSDCPSKMNELRT